MEKDGEGVRTKAPSLKSKRDSALDKLTPARKELGSQGRDLWIGLLS